MWGVYGTLGGVRKKLIFRYGDSNPGHLVPFPSLILFSQQLPLIRFDEVNNRTFPMPTLRPTISCPPPSAPRSDANLRSQTATFASEWRRPKPTARPDRRLRRVLAMRPSILQMTQIRGVGCL
ncbi:MAG: hypothetical protein Q9169_004750 [Polycauliona sp. 2 TL-2023]